ncbi:MAG: NAD(P)H-dependent oxidoreductase, partial [Desulfopila sp.]|nr:NAD(P)H-dependent oxidoreductase [Desulfopila sp.]
MEPLHIIGISGSLRQKSTNSGLLRFAKNHAPAEIRIHLADLDKVPFYNADLQEVPDAVHKLREDIGNADALLLACPE